MAALIGSEMQAGVAAPMRPELQARVAAPMRPEMRCTLHCGFWASLFPHKPFVNDNQLHLPFCLVAGGAGGGVAAGQG